MGHLEMAERPEENHKAAQREFMQREFQHLPRVTYDAHVHHDYFRAIPFQRVKRMLDGLGLTLNRQSVLVASCGSGIDVHYLRKFYETPTFHVSDYSENATRTAMQNLGVDGSVQDNERLTFSDNTFDYSFVSLSLHHLPRPLVGMYELLRVARKGVIVIEPNDALLTRIATRLGLATEVEASGNYVYRISDHDVDRMARSMFVSCKVDRCFAVHRVARSGLEFRVLKLLSGIANAVVPSQGNTIVFFIQKEQSA